jgi:multiple sugar transport system permease protein/raffinose/stachyose/melibiose transport system permease protein
MVISTIGVLKIFDLPFVMTSGGPGHSTETIAITIYNESFLANKIGYGTALSLMLFILVLLISSLQTL